MKDYGHWINGAYVASEAAGWIETSNPYTGEIWARFPKGTPADIEKAVAAAKAAMTSGPWATMSQTQRGKILRRIGDLILDHTERMTEIEVADHGKLAGDARGAMRFKSEIWHYYAGLADKIQGAVIPIDKPETFAYTLREPVGVVAAITAWNSPLQFLAVKCAPALAAGCACVIKPSEFAAISSLEFAAITKEAGLPDGVLNIVTGYGADVGDALVSHKDVALVTFTGSDATGARISETAGRGLKRVAMELGGKSPHIVFADADLESALHSAISGIFGASGQMCAAGSRLLVQNSIREEFTKRLVEIAKTIKLGDPMDPDTQMGPIANAPQFAKVMKYIDIAKADGATLRCGGKAAQGPGLTGDLFVEPTIFSDVTNDMRIAQEEVFGPILSIIGFEDEAEALALANDTEFGLVAGVWTADQGRMMRMVKGLETGTVWCNTYRTYSFMVPFGGRKRSGLGKEWGIEAINEFLETKAVMVSTAKVGPSFVPR